VKRLLALLAGAFGLRALLRRGQRPAYPQGASPADELRTRLAESRSTPEPFVAEPAVVEPETVESAEPASVDERRADVHNRARGAIDELKS
jgi:hypothetical protein